LTSGVVELGDQSVTVPAWDPRWIIALCGFCARAVGVPNLVGISQTIEPVLVS